MPQYSLTGNILDSAAPGKYYGPQDMIRRGVAAPLSDLISSNPNFKSRHGGGEQPNASYLADGLAYDVEGLLGAYAAKFGQDRGMQLLDALPYMSRQDLMEAQRAVQGAASEMGSVDKRERNRYEQAGLEQVNGQYIRPNSAVGTQR